MLFLHSLTVNTLFFRYETLTAEDVKEIMGNPSGYTILRPKSTVPKKSSSTSGEKTSPNSQSSLIATSPKSGGTPVPVANKVSSHESASSPSTPSIPTGASVGNDKEKGEANPVTSTGTPANTSPRV